MKLIHVSVDNLVTSIDLSRSGSAKSFEERLRSSISEIGLAEPLKVAIDPFGKFVVVDGNLRVRAIQELRKEHPDRFATVPAYILPYESRFEIRYQSDIYQDLLPSQLATLVEHLHRTERVRKNEIARYIGVSPQTLRNYTGLWRLLERGGLFADIVKLMDVEVLPSSNPYAWLRLTSHGIHRVLVEHFTEGHDPERWIVQTVESARAGNVLRYPLTFVEAATSSLPSNCYRVGEEVRAIKRDLGLRRSAEKPLSAVVQRARTHLATVSHNSSEPVLRSAAKSLQDYLA